jgi:hypothetical protein
MFGNLAREPRKVLPELTVGSSGLNFTAGATSKHAWFALAWARQDMPPEFWCRVPAAAVVIDDGQKFQGLPLTLPRHVLS